MKIGILSRNAKLYSTARIVEAGEKRGHSMHVVDPLFCYMDVTSQRPTVYFRNKKLDDFDAIIPRIGASVTFFATAVLRQFEVMGVYSLNESVAISRSRDKLRALQLLARKGIGMPVTGFAHSTKMTADLVKLVGGAPLVIKLLEGTQGTGVVLAETTSAAESVIDAFRDLDAYFLVQELIEESKGTDVRCFVVGGKVIASMTRKAKAGEFRSNLHRGGVAEAVKLTPEERKAAVRAADAMGLAVAGVDILRSNHGPLVIEVNSSPGLEGIEKATGVDIGSLIIDHIEKNAKLKSKNQNRTKGKG
jgi:ribosomal protein S6--L-glutamate ligase